ncbi:MAG: nucleotidyltransferase family protein [Acidobacteriaceae bacterium]
MSRAPSHCGVILAAGESRRMGQNKAFLPWPPEESPATPPKHTFLSAAIHALNGVNDMVIVVAGNNESELMPVVYACGGRLVRNPSPERGQFSSLQVGLREVLNHGRSAAMITLVDRPPPRIDTLQLLVTAFERSSHAGNWAVVPEYQGKHGHPFMVGREMIEAFLRAPATSIARELEHANQQHIEYVAVDDPFVATNVDTPEDYEALRRTLPRS